MRSFGEIPKGRGFAVRVTRDNYQGHEVVDVRVWFENRPGDPDTFRPTPKGASIPVRNLPALLAALNAAGADALQSGLLRSAHFEAAGVPVPDRTRKAA